MRAFYVSVAVMFVVALTFFNLSAEAGSRDTANLKDDQVTISTNRLIIKYREGVERPGKAGPASEGRMRIINAAAGLQLRYMREMSGNAHVLQLPNRISADRLTEIIDRIDALSDVEYVEPDYIVFPVLSPNDPSYGNQWHYFGTYGVNAPAAWDITIGSSDIKIAVIDTGITNHADLMGRWVGGYDFVSDVMIANDGDARDDNPRDPGDWITVAENSSGYFEGCGVDNSSWHGTHVAGTIGATSNNGLGVAGINWNSLIVPVRVLGKCGGYLSDIVDGMRWSAGLSVSGVPANSNPARVLNLSLGGSGVCGTTLQNAINEIRNVGSVIVVAAGNENVNLNSTNVFPANCNGVITVTATTNSGSRASYSNYGTTVEISAPGSLVYSTIDGGFTAPVSDGYAFYSGTSMATPHVAGIVSLMLSIDPSLTPDEVLGILQNTVKPFPANGGCSTLTCGSGIVNAGAAVEAVTAALGLPDLIITNVSINPPVPGNNLPFDVIITIKNQGGPTGPVDVYRDVYIGVDPLTMINPLTGCPKPGDYFRIDTFANLAPGQTDTRAVTITNGLAIGDHQLWVYVDSRCLIAELGEVNNGQ